MKFLKTGESHPEPLSVIYARDADKAARERTEAEAQIVAKEARLDDLSMAVDQGEPEATAEYEQLEREIVELHKIGRRKTRVERDLRTCSEAELKSEQWQRDQRNRKKQAKKSGERIDPARRIEKHGAALLLAIRDLQASSDALHIAWNETWPFKGPVLTYPEKLLTLIGHELYAQAKAMGVKWPAVEYSQSNWPGLSAKIREADNWTKATLLGDEPPIEEVYEPPLPAPIEPEPAAAEPPLHPSTWTEEDQRARDFVKAADEAAAARDTRAPGTDFNVFDPMQEI